MILKNDTLEGMLELSDELSPKQPAQDVDVHEEPFSTTDPALPVEAQAAARDDAVQMGMELKILSPGMQQREAAELGAEMLGVSSERQQRFGSGPEQHPVNDSAILQRQRCQLVREGEYDMEVLHIQNLTLARLEPRRTRRPLTLRTVPIPAGVVNRDLPSALLTLLEMTTQSCRSTLRKVVQDTILLPRGAVALQVSCAVVSDDIGHFRPMSRHLSGSVSLASASRSTISGRGGFGLVPPTAT